jgi:hypothetical protein
VAGNPELIGIAIAAEDVAGDALDIKRLAARIATPWPSTSTCVIAMIYSAGFTVRFSSSSVDKRLC